MSNGQTNDQTPVSDALARAESLIRAYPTAATALQAAALLPPGAVPWPWLRELAAARHTEMAATPSLWQELQGQLEPIGNPRQLQQHPLARETRASAE